MNQSSKINRHNNFDFIRLLLSSMVIISHSFPLTGSQEIFAKLTNNQMSLGSLAVDSFFVLSGYFIFISLQRSKTLFNYLWKRILRLFPALIVLVIFTLIIIPTIYKGPNILLEKTYWQYAPNILSLYRVQYTINGVFTNNLYPKMINDSLWSLSYEFTMYMSLLVFYFIKNKKTALFGVTFTFITFYFLSIYKPLFLGKYFQLFNLETNRLYHLAMIFLAGSALTFFNLSKINYLSIRILCAISLLIILYLGWYNILSSFILPLLILLVGQIATPILSTLGEKVGDISYGVYIYGFIIQQILMNYFSFSPIQLMSLSLPITFAIAYFSWHLIEKKMMKYKELI